MPASPKTDPTPREMEVLTLLCEGRTTNEISAELGIAFKTVVTHRSSLMKKAGAQNSILLFRWALENGYVRCEAKENAVPPAKKQSLTDPVFSGLRILRH